MEVLIIASGGYGIRKLELSNTMGSWHGPQKSKTHAKPQKWLKIKFSYRSPAGIRTVSGGFQIGKNCSDPFFRGIVPKVVAHLWQATGESSIMSQP
jgi:hypothetical protein